jgi:ankyrin repeat protein
LLLNQGANLEAKGEKRRTALHYACDIGDKAVRLRTTALLLDCGANTEARVFLGTTVLMIAVQANQNELVELLLNSGAMVNATNLYGQSSLDIACSAGNLELCTLLLGSGAEFPTNAERRQLDDKVKNFLTRIEKTAILTGKEISYKTLAPAKHKIEELIDSNSEDEEGYVEFRSNNLSLYQKCAIFSDVHHNANRDLSCLLYSSTPGWKYTARKVFTITNSQQVWKRVSSVEETAIRQLLESKQQPRRATSRFG